MKQAQITKWNVFESIFVIVLVSILFLIAYLAVNPEKNSLDARNRTRIAHVSEILNAVSTFVRQPGKSVYDLGEIPDCTKEGFAIIGSSEVNLEKSEVKTFLNDIPKDPLVGDDNDTGYRICTDNKQIRISSPFAEGQLVISIQR